MRKILLILVLGFPFFLFGQAIDSTEIKQVDSLIQVALKLTRGREFDKAIEINETAENLALEKWGRASVFYGNTCHNHGRILYFAGMYAEAEKWYLEAKSIQENVLGKAHPEYASILTNLGLLYKEMTDYEKAEPLFQEAKSIWEKVLGKAHPDYASSLNNLAILYWSKGDYLKAEPLFLETKSIREKALGKVHPNYASSLNNLAYLYKDMGEYEKAEPLFQESKSIREKVLGKAHPDYASGLNNLANLYLETGEYEKAEPLYLEAKVIQENILGKAHPDYAMSVHNIGTLYLYMGDYKAAEPLFEEAKSIREKTLGKTHPDYLWSLNNLTVVYFYTGEYKKAEPLLLEIRIIREKTLGNLHPDYATSLDNLGSLYLKMDKYDIAEPLLLEAKTIRETALGKTHPDYALSISNLGYLYQDKGNYEKAESLYLEAKTIREQILGKNHTNYVSSLYNLAILYSAAGNLNAAKSEISEAVKLEKNLLLKASQYLSERELSAYIQTFENGSNHLLSFAQIQPDLIADCYNNSLFYKGFLLTSLSKVRKLALTDVNTTEKYKELASYQRRLAAEYAKPIVEQKEGKELEEKANTLEKELARTVAGFGEAIRQVSWQEVQQKLKPGEAAIEFVHYKYMNPNPTDSTMYAALVLRPGVAQPIFIPLFEEKQLDKLLQGKEKTRADYINNLYTSNITKSSLYELLWQPLEQALNGVSTIYFSPSGLLHRINMAAIPLQSPLRGQATEETLADHYQLIEVGSTRQLTIDNSEAIKEQSRSNEALLYGGIQYEVDSTAIASAISDLGTNSLANRGGFGFNNADTTLRGGNWNYLKWTEVEVNAIETILSDAGLRPTIRGGFNGSEESFKLIGTSTPAPRVLHLATHGFFFPDPKKLTSEREESVFKISDHPMIRSGIILSGGNHAWQTGKPFRPNLEDGILTAYEISQMNLSGTELVVLSACETGLGDIQGNEGVYGLQRAFKIAGVKYLIMSLWQVPDYQTQELMTTFYSNWLDEKMPIPDAFRAAQKAMKTKYKNPFFWAGFVLVE